MSPRSPGNPSDDPDAVLSERGGAIVNLADNLLWSPELGRPAHPPNGTWPCFESGLHGLGGSPKVMSMPRTRSITNVARPVVPCPGTERSRAGGVHLRSMKPPLSITPATAAGILACAVGVPSSLAKDFGDYLSYSVGNLAIQPQYAQTEIYTDNLFLSNGANRVGDLTSVFSPGLKLQYGADGRNEMHFSAGHDEFVLVDNGDKNTHQDRMAFDLKMVVSRFTIEGQDSVSWMSSFIGGVLNQTRQLVDRRVWTDNWKVTYDWTAKTDFYLVGLHQDTDYQTGLRLFDQNDLKATLGTSYLMTAKYRLLVEGFYGQTALNSNVTGLSSPPFSSVYGGYVGARGEFTRKLSGDLRVGYEQREFNGGKSVAAQTPAISADLIYAFRPKTSLTLLYSRSSAPSPQVGSQFQIADTVGINVNQSVGSSGKWMLRAHANYVTSAFNSGSDPKIDQTRDDQYLRAGLTLLYQPRAWMNWSLGYEFENYTFQFRDAVAAKSFVLPQYHANRVTLALAIGY